MSSVDTVAFLVHTQINVSTSEEVFSPIKRVFFSAAAKQQQTAAGSSSTTTADGSSHSETGGGAVEMTSVVVSLGSKHSGYSPEHDVARKS